MSKSKEYITTLISPGKIVENLHFGPFCHNWWFARPINKNPTHTPLLPIRLGMKTHTVLKKCDFIITVVKDTQHPNSPGFLCFSEEYRSGVCSSPTDTCYEKVFHSNAKFPGPQVMGFDNSNIIQQLLDDIIFRPYMISLEKLNVIVLGMGKSKKPEWNYAGEGYKSVFQSHYNGIKSAFIQEIEDEECVVQIYTNDTLIKTYNAIDPNEVWLCIGRLSNYSGKKIFGLENPYTQICIQQAQIPSCTVLDWTLEGVLENLYKYHLKRRISREVKWHLFNKWLNQKSDILELRKAILDLYPSGYEINEREWRAWRAFVRNAGCTNITPSKMENLKLFEFWTKSDNVQKDSTTLQILYESGFLQQNPYYQENQSLTFWQAFRNALENTNRGPNGQRRILSIIATKFTYQELRSKLGVAANTVSRAHQYARINGPGAPQAQKPIIVKDKLGREKKENLEQFFSDKANVIMSSYKTDTITQEPVHYLKNTKQDLWEKFHEKYPSGVKRTTFYKHLQGNRYIYRENLGGLCSICNTYGYETFDELTKLIQNHISNLHIQNQLLDQGEKLKRYLKREYESHLTVNSDGTTAHNQCINHCLPFAFGICNEQHTHTCSDCDALFQFFIDIEKNTPNNIHEEIYELRDQIFYYLSHQTRKVFLNSQFNANLLDLDEKGAIIIVDYKMKILPKSARETKIFDHWSADTCQDAWFTASSLHAVIESLEVKPDWVTFLSDNGPHYHNADLMLILGHWNEWYNISVKKWVFLEAGEAKTSIDSHHAQISHAINRYVRLGFDINEGVDIENAIQGICGTSVAHLEPERKKESGRKKKNSIPGNSNWYEWSWPTEGEYAGFIQARAMPNIGTWKNFEPAKIAQFEKRPLEKPNSQVSDHSIPTSNWNIPLPHRSKINTNRLTIEELKKQLKEYGVDTDVSNNRVILAEILQNKLNDEISPQNIGKSFLP
ncbi:hypothetical protein GLOIN_2v1880126 [Rhizophagus irregularis DAOM 181602=DAOM 197198]|nr:hypothetical protein GLOIN_2v1880126 [Rhizophagus irregularis DAOM 181602=DAOM 197198]